MTDKVIMIGKNCPRFQPPFEFLCHGEQSTVKHLDPFATVKVMALLIGPRRDHVGSALTQPVMGRMWPINLWHC